MIKKTAKFYHDLNLLDLFCYYYTLNVVIFVFNPMKNKLTRT